MYKLNHIEFSGEKYPYLIDLNVLETIQEKYRSIQIFEQLVYGLRPILDKDGTQKENDKGEKLYRKVEPNMAAINFVLPEMINEGLAVEADRQGKEYTPVDPMKIMADCDISFEELSELIHEEFSRRFVSKKSKHSESRPRRRNPSTSNGSGTSGSGSD